MPRYVYSPRYYCDLGIHVFRTEKYGLLYREMLRTGLAKPDDFADPPFPKRAQLELVHTPEYIDDLFACRMTERTERSEMAINAQIVHAFLLGTGGTLRACQLATANGGPTMNLSGGFHHAFPDYAEGFCYVNDVAVALRVMMRDGAVRRPIIIDCDLHQGNGTAFVFEDDPDVFTFSIHQENLYPIKQRSNIDLGLPDGCSGRAYLDALRENLPRAIERHQPDFAVYVAGADPFKEDMLGSLHLTLNDLQERDAFVLRECTQRRIPSTTVLAGGYCRRVEDTVKVHLQTARAVAYPLETVGE